MTKEQLIKRNAEMQKMLDAYDARVDELKAELAALGGEEDPDVEEVTEGGHFFPSCYPGMAINSWDCPACKCVAAREDMRKSSIR